MKQDLLEFDLELALQGNPVKTRDGRKVSDVKVIIEKAAYSASQIDEYNDEEYIQGLTAVIHNPTGQHTHSFYHSGGSHRYGLTTEADLTTS